MIVHVLLMKALNLMKATITWLLNIVKETSYLSMKRDIVPDQNSQRSHHAR